ncbi:hypothetical protein [Breznakiella homolactica]|uniref:Uncharacterized protein n=1 Tax=Breznakiella homolactica TaxID=2798577 RepID=A0A7T7XJS0_9SPIR|nr:hypothetical protein [Breznakiella homolactica]QQO07585.1 hypothetical protein JFL75_11570 [Breznakiella homolactica]
MKEEYGDWEIIPRRGLGKIRFGMTSDEVRGFDSIYGEREMRIKRTTTYEDFEENMGPFLDDMDQESRESIRKGLEETYKNKEVIYMEPRQSSCLQLTFVNDSLTEIMAVWELDTLTCKGENLFDMEPEDAVKLLAKALGETPLAKDQEIVFPESCIHLWDFSQTYRDRVRFLDLDEDEIERTILWLPEPGNGERDFSGCIKVTF